MLRSFFSFTFFVPFVSEFFLLCDFQFYCSLSQAVGTKADDGESDHKPAERKVVKEPSGPITGDLMAEIARGKQLRSAQEARPAELPPQPQGGLAGALNAALEANRKVLGGAVDNDDDDGSDWD
jgi:hypothetical protein